MEEKYKTWIKNNVSENPLGTCSKVTSDMLQAFPELTKVRGHYYCPIWGERGHWWLKDSNNNIIDPTVTQFPSAGNGEYVEWTEGDEEPTGKCMNCGDYCYNNNQICCAECEYELLANYK